jgi:hypothetical protein
MSPVIVILSSNNFSGESTKCVLDMIIFLTCSKFWKFYELNVSNFCTLLTYLIANSRVQIHDEV